MGRVAGAALALASLLVSGAAVAQTRPVAATRELPARVRIEPPGCAAGPFDAGAWIGLLRNELATDGIETVAPAAGASEEAGSALAVIRVEIDPCEATATEVTIAIDDELTRKSVRRAVALDDVAASGRPRALALAVAELLRASWAELALPEAQAPAASVPAAVRRAILLRLRPTVLAQVGTPAPLEEVQRWGAGGLLDVRFFPGQNGALLGGRVLATLRPARGLPWLRLRADAGGAYGIVFDRVGEIDIGMASLGVAAQATGGLSQVELALGLRVEAGWVTVEGRVSDPGAMVLGRGGSGAVALGGALGTLRVVLARGWATLVDVFVGYTLQPLTISALSQRAAGLQGPGVALGLGFAGAW